MGDSSPPSSFPSFSPLSFSQSRFLLLYLSSASWFRPCSSSISPLSYLCMEHFPPNNNFHKTLYTKNFPPKDFRWTLYTKNFPPNFSHWQFPIWTPWSPWFINGSGIQSALGLVANLQSFLNFYFSFVNLLTSGHISRHESILGTFRNISLLIANLCWFSNLLNKAAFCMVVKCKDLCF